MRRQNVLLWVFGLGGLCLALVWIGSWVFLRPASSSKASVTLLQTGQSSPDFDLHTTLGEHVRLSQYLGRPVVIYFWATWCGPCKVEMPALQKLYQQHSHNGLVLLAVNYKSNLADVISFGSALGLTYPLLLDADGQVTDGFGINSFPTTLFINQQGDIRRIQVGVLDKNDLEQYLLENLVVTTVSPTPLLTATMTQKPVITTAAPLFLEGCVNIPMLNARLGPGKNYAVVKGFQKDRCLIFDGRSSDSRWLRVSMPVSDDGSPVWVSKDFIDLKGNIDILPPLN